MQPVKLLFSPSGLPELLYSFISFFLSFFFGLVVSKDIPTMENHPSSAGAVNPTENSIPPELSVRERMRLIRAQGRAVVKPLESENIAVTPSTAGDIAASAAPPETDPWLDTLSQSSLHHQPGHEMAPATSIETPAAIEPLTNDDVDPAPTIAPQDIHINPLDSSLEPSRLSKVPKPPVSEQELISDQITRHLSHDAPIEEEPESHGLRLGADEFAIALPMDYRVHDAYETILVNQNAFVEDFLTNTPTSEVSKKMIPTLTETHGEFQLILFIGGYAHSKNAEHYQAIGQRLHPCRFEHVDKLGC